MLPHYFNSVKSNERNIKHAESVRNFLYKNKFLRLKSDYF